MFEAVSRQTARILEQNNGFRWGADLAVGGIQVSEHDVEAAIRLNPFDATEAIALQQLARFGWAAGRDLDALSVWCRPSDRGLYDLLRTPS